MEPHNVKRLDRSLRELIAAAGEVAFEYSHTDQEGYRLARLALIEIIKNRNSELEPAEPFNSARNRYLN